MLDYFSDNSASMKGRVLDPSFISIQRSVINYLPKVKQRVQSSSRFVPPTHLLYRILSGLALTEGTDSAGLRQLVRRRSRKLATALNVTSPSSYGKLFHDQFLNGGNESIIFTHDRFDQTSWHKLAPVKFLYHTNTNVNYQIGTDDDANQYAFVSINVQMLAYQFLKWREWRTARGAEESAYMFIAKYVLYNAVESYMDISLFNRHYYRVIGKAIPQEPKVHEFPIPNIEDRLDKSNVKVINSIMSRSISASQCLYNTPSLFKESALDLTTLPNVIETNQIEWFLLAIQLPYIHYGLQVSYTTGDSVNQKDMSSLLYELRAFTNSRTLSHVSKHMKVHIIDSYMEPLLELCSALRS